MVVFETGLSSDNYSPKIAFQVNYLHKNGNKSILNRSIGNDFLWKNSLSNPRKETLNLWKSTSHPKQRSFNATVGTGTNPKYFTWQTGTTGRCGGNFLGNLRRHLLCLDVQNTNRWTNRRCGRGEEKEHLRSASQKELFNNYTQVSSLGFMHFLRLRLRLLHRTDCCCSC